MTFDLEPCVLLLCYFFTFIFLLFFLLLSFFNNAIEMTVGAIVPHLGLRLLQGQWYLSLLFLLNSCVLWFEIEIVCPILKYFIIFPQSYLPCWKLQIGWDSVMIMSADKRDLFLYEAFLYFNPLLLAVSSPPQHTVLVCHSVRMHWFTHLHIHLLYHVSYLFVMFQALMVWLWGINLWFFAQGGVNYAKIFDLDQNHLTHREIWKVSTHHFDLCLVWHIKSAFCQIQGE